MSNQPPSGRRMQFEMRRAATRGNGLAFVYWLRLMKRKSNAAKNAEAAKILAEFNSMAKRLAEEFRPLLAQARGDAVTPPDPEDQ